MKAGGRLALYGAGLVVAFGAAFGVAGAVIPDSVVTAWGEGADANAHGATHGGAEQADAEQVPAGLSMSAGGFSLTPVQAPTAVGQDGELSFQVMDASGEPLTEYTTAHEKDLHLIVVRTDGAQFEHVHPELDASSGTWSVPWSWQEPGTYRVYADFTPAGEAEGLTLTRMVEVAGDFAPVQAQPQTTATVDGYTVTIEGDLVAGSSSEVTVSVERDGAPVTTLEPYLGAFGHLVALRDGDMAYLHVHAAGEDPEAGDLAGPEIVFGAEIPTAGTYLLYLDFQVDGVVHTAEFVLDAELGDGTTTDDSHSGDH